MRIAQTPHCTNPAKSEGFIIYNKDHKVAQFCNGTDWIGMAGGTTSIMTGDTMVTGWPDAIFCTTASGTGTGEAYVYSYVGEGIFRINDPSNGYQINFSSSFSTASFNSTAPGYLGSTNCDGKTIAQLYADGQAFNFVGGQPVITDTLTDLSCTDGQMVLYDTASTAWICADVSASGAADNLGNHIATQTLDMASYGIDNVESITLDSVVGGAAPVSSSDNGVPSGAVMAFDLASCPTGWSEYTAARGRFPRGIDPTGTNDPDGVRTAGSVQTDAFQGHNHMSQWSNTVQVSGGAGVLMDQKANDSSMVSETNRVLGPISDGTNGTPRTGTETRPKNFAVLYCRKD